MQNANDMELIREYATRQSNEAFAILVQRHIDLVHSAALRQVQNSELAQEITQVVFIVLAQKAHTLRSGTILPGWLYRTAQFTARDALKRELRRQRREQEAHMQSILNEPETEPAWENVAPFLDEAMTQLGDADRNAVVLRFFQNKSLGEVGALLGTNEDTARKRVTRALEKLRKIFARRGCAVGVTALAGVISANAVQAAPIGLASTVTATAAVKGATAGASTITLLKGVLKIMAWTKMKTAVVIGTALILATGTTTVAVKKLASSTSGDESWWEVNSAMLDKAPRILLIKPTTHPHDGGWTMRDDHALGLNNTIHSLISVAYHLGRTRSVFPNNLPKENFDFLINLPRDNNLALREELRKKFGIVAHREKRETNVLILKVTTPGAPGLKSSTERYGRSSSGTGNFSMGRQPIDSLASYLEGVFQIPVLNETGLSGNYDIELKWQQDHLGDDQLPSELQSLKRVLAEQFGLELVESVEPIELLIVERRN